MASIETRIWSLLHRHVDTDEEARYLYMAIGRVLARDIARAPENAEEILSAAERPVRLTADWIASAVAEGAWWLSKTDAVGRPKKLMKFGSVDAVLHEVARHNRRFAERMRAESRQGGGIEPIMDLADGWRLVRLVTPEALDAESAMMDNCVGRGRYDRFLDGGYIDILSLRDPAGFARMTIEFDRQTGEVLQMEGRSNEIPDLTIRQRIMPFLRSRTVILPSSLPFVRGVDGILFDLEDLPDEVEVIEFLNCQDYQISSNCRFLKVRGGAHIHTPSQLPTRIEVSGELRILWPKPDIVLPHEVNAAKGCTIFADGDTWAHRRAEVEAIGAKLRLPISPSVIPRDPLSFSSRRLSL